MEGINVLEKSPWVLVIEALLNMQQLDLSIVLDLIKSVPNVCDELGRNVRDLISIRVLENLYARGISNKESNVKPRSETRMDVSNFCEEVVSLVVRGGCNGDSEIDEKRMLEVGFGGGGCMQDSTVYRGKNGILMDGSGMRVADENSGVSVPGDVSDWIGEKRGVCDNKEVKRKLSSLYQLKNGILKGSDPVLKGLMDGSGMRVADENRGVSIPGDVSDEIGEKRGVCENEDVKRKLSSFTSEDDEISEGNIYAERLSPVKRDRNIVVDRNCEVVSPEPCGTFGESPKKLKRVLLCFPKNHCELSASAFQHEKLGDSSSRTIEHIEEPMDRDTRPEVHTVEENTEENGSSEANDSISHSLENNVGHDMSNKNDVHRDNLEISSDGDEYRDVRTDIAMTKDCFLSSQGIDTQDSFGTRLNSCVKCNKGGNVLSCNSSSCPLVVHEECLGSATDFDRIGNFYCPFCAYQGAVSRYQEAKKKFSLSRTDLMNFHAFRAAVEVKKLSKKCHGSKNHESSEIENISEHIEPTTNNDLLNEDIGNLIPPSKLDGKVGEPSKSSLRVETPCEENEKSGCRDRDVVPGRETHNRMSEKLPCQSDSDATVEEGFNAESEISDASRYCIRLGKLGRQIKDPIAQLRKKLAWTNVEGQTIKTWEFNPEDPNDKWSNIWKGSPRSK